MTKSQEGARKTRAERSKGRRGKKSKKVTREREEQRCERGSAGAPWLTRETGGDWSIGEGCEVKRVAIGHEADA